MGPAITDRDQRSLLPYRTLGEPLATLLAVAAVHAEDASTDTGVCLWKTHASLVGVFY